MSSWGNARKPYVMITQYDIFPIEVKYHIITFAFFAIKTTFIEQHTVTHHVTIYLDAKKTGMIFHMTIFRVEHNKNYTTINNTICKDNRLSWKAKGIWMYAFSRPDDWEFNISDLINQSTDGRDSVRQGLKELEKCGYLVRQQKRVKGAFNSYDWQFHETPQELKKSLPETDFPSPAKPTLLSTDNNKQQQSRHEKPAAPVVVFSCLEKIADDQVPLEEKQRITQKFHSEEQTVIDAVSCVLQKGFDPQVSILKSLRAALKGKWKPSPANPEGMKKNIRINRDYCLGYPVKIKDNNVIFPSKKTLSLETDLEEFTRQFNKMLKT